MLKISSFYTCVPKTTNHMRYSSWDMKWNKKNFLLFWDIVSPLPTLTTQKILKKIKKHLQGHHLHLCTKNHDLIIRPYHHVGDHFWAQGKAPKKLKFFFQDKFYSLKAHAHYFTVLIYLAAWRAVKLGIFTHFTFPNLTQCSQSINSLIYVYSIQVPGCLLRVLDHSHDCTSLYYIRPRKFFCITPWSCMLL